MNERNGHTQWEPPSEARVQRDESGRLIAAGAAGLALGAAGTALYEKKHRSRREYLPIKRPLVLYHDDDVVVVVAVVLIGCLGSSSSSSASFSSAGSISRGADYDL